MLVELKEKRENHLHGQRYRRYKVKNFKIVCPNFRYQLNLNCCMKIYRGKDIHTVMSSRSTLCQCMVTKSIDLS